MTSFAIFALDYSFILLMIHLQSCSVAIKRSNHFPAKFSATQVLAPER